MAKAIKSKSKERKIEELVNTCEGIELNAIKTLSGLGTGRLTFEFKRLKAISKQMADAFTWLGQSQYYTLSFESLEEITQQAAEKLAYKIGNLKLGLQNLKIEIAEALPL